jgi:hypothetical protein
MFGVLLILLGVVDGGLSFLFGQILYAGNLMNNWMGTVNYFVFGLAVLFLLCFIVFLFRVKSELSSTDGSGTDVLGCLILPIIFLFRLIETLGFSLLVFIIGCVGLILIFIFTDISILFRTNMFLYYASPVVMVAAGTGIIKILQSFE